jgi:hypothetical protein
MSHRPSRRDALEDGGKVCCGQFIGRWLHKATTVSDGWHYVPTLTGKPGALCAWRAPQAAWTRSLTLESRFDSRRTYWRW